jgi:alkyl hydroperoxide reductase subunit F
VRSTTDAKSRANCANCWSNSPQLSPGSAARDGDGDRVSRRSRSAARHHRRCRFAGIPLGHEFTSLVLALLQVGGHPSKLAQELIAQVRALDGDYRSKPISRCQLPELPGRGAGAEPDERAQPEASATSRSTAHCSRAEVEARQVMSVPTVFLNGVRCSLPGAWASKRSWPSSTPARRARAAMQIAAKARRSTCWSSAAARPVRRRRSTPRARASAPASPPNVSAGRCWTPWRSRTSSRCRTPKARSWPTALEQHVRDYDVDIMNLQRAERPCAGRAPMAWSKSKLASGATLSAKTVILATGARWRQMNVPGEADYRNKGVAYCPHCDGPLFKGKRVAVIGGGNSGVEAAIDLAGIVAHVTLIEFDGKLRADEVLQRKLRSLPNVDTVITSRADHRSAGRWPESDRPDLSGSRHARRSMHAGAGRHLRADRPAAQHRMAEGHAGTVAARRDRRSTSAARPRCPGVFAAGDATTVPYKQIVIAMGAGATAALGAFDHMIRQSAPSDTHVSAAA